MPSGLGKLTCLRTLSAFVMGKSVGCKLKELHGLKLRGNISILNLENIADAKDVEGVNFEGKEKLQSLELVWAEQQDPPNISN
uniref:R13L1/DRL21-like LRR repeat region domain-containing protein n=1 Tax=Nelumbo nucifera TaxID=4432 RepID=A0A822Z9B1_NELNU|nr:TPA_asm: hypothetical protein HUJ06_013969 [Nelumbo nucifera]